jgi:hypothetical protein
MPEFRVNYAIIERYVLKGNERTKVYTSLPSFISEHRQFSCTDELVKFVNGTIGGKIHNCSPLWIHNVASLNNMQWIDTHVSSTLECYVRLYPNCNPSEVLPRRFVTVYV